LSLESGKKLGFTASIINIIVPVILVTVLGTFYAILISTILGRFSTGVPSAFTGAGFSFVFLGIIIVVGALSLVGYILFLVAMHRLSQYYNERQIFSNLIRALIIQIVAAVVLTVVVVALVTISSSSIAATPTTTPAAVLSIFAVYAVAALVVLGTSIYCAVLYKHSFDKLAEKSGVDNFRTVGLLYLIGTILSIIFIGGIIVWVAWIFAAMGYNKLQPAPSPPAPFVPPYQQGIAMTKRCPTCGAENSPDAVYCRNCGRLL
jgi:Predicted membrane protein